MNRSVLKNLFKNISNEEYKLIAYFIILTAHYAVMLYEIIAGQ